MTVESVNTHESTDTTPEGHNEAMMAKVDEVNKFLEEREKGEQLDAPKEKIAGKFDSVEELEKAYKELEKKLGQPREEKEEPAEEPQETAEELVEKAGLNMEEMSQHYDANGQLSDEHYKALEGAGIPRAYVDAYISGLEAQAERMENQIMATVGGREQYVEMTEWAKANLEPADIKAYNKAMDSGDADIMKQAVLGMAYRYSKAEGKSPKLLQGEGKGSSGGFQSVAQLTAAMADPRYDKDPAYRKEIQDRLSRSNIL